MSLIESKLLELPKYCDLYRFFIVEELIFVQTPLHYHHGKCAVIGRIAFDNGDYYLENIILRTLNSEYQVPSGSLRILLLLDKGLSGEVNSNAEVNGETVFWRKTDDTNNHSKMMLKSTCDLVRTIRSKFIHFNDEHSAEIQHIDEPINREACTFDTDNISKYLEHFSKEFVHAIKVHNLNPIDIADEVISCNLMQRKLIQKLDELL